MFLVSISLLPQEYRQQIKLQRRQRVILLTGVTAIFLLAILWGIVFISERGAGQQLESLVAYRRLIERQINNMAGYEELYTQVMDIYQVTDRIRGDRVDYPGLLLELSSVIPHGVSLTDIKLSASHRENNQNTGELSLSGVANNYALVAQLVEELRNTSGLTNARHLYAGGSLQESVIYFEITAELVERETNLQ